MIVIREFEIMQDEGYWLALPCDMDGGTQGHSFDDAVAMAAEWLRLVAEDALAREQEIPGGGLGHEPCNGGKVVAVAIDADLTRVPAVTAAEAARRLGVSTARVAQLCKSGALLSWRVGGIRMVALDSIAARLSSLEESPAPERDPVPA